MKNPNKKEKEYYAKVAALGCLICGRPAEIHHINKHGMNMRKGNHKNIVPLCPDHHRLGKAGQAIHNCKHIFLANYNFTEESMLEMVQDMLETPDIYVEGKLPF